MSDAATIAGVDHVQITIPAGYEEEARAFYVDLLGLRERPKPAALRERGGFWLSVGPHEVHVGVDREQVGREKTRAHVAYRVRNLAGWRRLLSAADVAIEEAVPIAGAERLYVRDPFGNRLELIERLNDRSAETT